MASKAERMLAGRLGAYTMLSRHDPRETTRKARLAFNARFEREIDPNGVLDAAERARRAEMARRAYFVRLALKSAQGRRRRATSPSKTISDRAATEFAEAPASGCRSWPGSAVPARRDNEAEL